MTDRELMQQALEALRDADNYCPVNSEAEVMVRLSITALRERLAQPYCDDCGGTDPECPLAQPEQTVPSDYSNSHQQEPVAWQWLTTAHFRKHLPKDAEPGAWNALYTAPVRREWVGLDRKEMLAIIDQQQTSKQTGLPMFYRDQCLDMARAIEAKLRERNA